MAGDYLALPTTGAADRHRSIARPFRSIAILGDADAGYEPDTPEHRLQLTLLFGVVGTLFFGGGLWRAGVQQRRDASSGGA
jgi:hypothetical protein